MSLPIQGGLEAPSRQLLAHYLAGLPFAQSPAAVRLWDAPSARPNIFIVAVRMVLRSFTSVPTRVADRT
jgi:hypothetical protein